MLGFKRLELFFHTISVWMGLLQPLEENYFELFQTFFKWAVYVGFKMQYRVNGST